MNVVLLRVGLDTGCGGSHSPLFADGTFEFVPIPDDRGIDPRTYGNTVGRHGRTLVNYLPQPKQGTMALSSMHVDPEFESFTYGDPTPPKRGLRKLNPGDLLVFYAGMEGWGWEQRPALYLVGYFEVKQVGVAVELGDKVVQVEFSANFHVRHSSVYREQRERLLLIKGGAGSRLYQRAHLLGATVRKENGSSWQIISDEMTEVFGRFGGIGSIQRSNPRWVEAQKVPGAAAFVRSLR